MKTGLDMSTWRLVIIAQGRGDRSIAPPPYPLIVNSIAIKNQHSNLVPSKTILRVMMMCNVNYKAEITQNTKCDSVLMCLL